MGLSDNNGKVTVKVNPRYLDIDIDGWSPGVTHDRQIFPFDAMVTMSLVHFDATVLSNAMKNSVLSATEGTEVTGGTLLGAGGGLKTLSLSSPGPAATTWQFNAVYLREGYEFPLGAERSVVRITFHAVPYTSDPYNAGQGAGGVVVYT